MLLKCNANVTGSVFWGTETFGVGNPRPILNHLQSMRVLVTYSTRTLARTHARVPVHAHTHKCRSHVHPGSSIVCMPHTQMQFTCSSWELQRVHAILRSAKLHAYRIKRTGACSCVCVRAFACACVCTCSCACGLAR